LTVIEQTAQTLGVSTSVSAVEISDLPAVRVSAAEPRLIHLFTAIDKTAHDDFRVSASLITSTIPAASAQVMAQAGVSVSIQLCPSSIDLLL
jgi:hypothetical protein